MRVSDAGLAMLKELEGCKLEPYECSAGVATVGYGATYGLDGEPIDMCQAPISQAEAEQLFERDVNKFGEGVLSLIDVPLTQAQFDALVSFSYNVGLGAFGESTLRRKLLECDYMGASEEFPKWCYAGGEISQGLANRRVKEQAMFLNWAYNP